MADDYSIQVGDTSIGATSVTNGVSVYNCFVDVVRSTKVNGPGGITPNTSTIVTNMPCAIKRKTGREKYLFNKQTHYLDAVLRCRVPAGVTILSTDRIVYSGDTYEIVDKPEDVNNLGILLIIRIKKVK